MDKVQSSGKHGKVYQVGEVLFREGDATGKLWVINDGRVRLTKRVFDLDIEVETLGRGDFCGELALVTESVQPVTATVIEEARLLMVDASQFGRMIRSNGEVAVRTLAKMAGRLIESQHRLVHYSLRYPLARLMLQLRWEQMEAGPGANVVSLPDDLGPILCLERIEVENLLDELVRRGLIELLEGKSFRILDQKSYDQYLSYWELKSRYS